MSLVYKIKTPQGQTVEMTAQQIMAQANPMLQQAGKAIQAVSPDGQYAQMIQDGQAYTVPLPAFLKAAGLQVEDAMPPDDQTVFDAIHPGWRFAISNLEDDDQKKAYLKSKLEKEGIKNVDIVGSGRDFRYFDPAVGKWRGLTNSPDWDLADLTEIGTTGARVLGGVLGSIGGGAAGTAVAPGVGTVGGAMAGGAAGTAAGEAATRWLASLGDEEYQQAFDMDKALKAGGISTAIGGAAPGVAKGIGVLGSKLFGAAAPYVGAPVSTALRGGGTTAQGVGRVAQMAEIGATRPGQFAGAVLTPGLSEASMVGATAQLPQMGVKGLGAAGRWIGEKTGVRSLARGLEGETGEQILGNLGRQLGQRMPAREGIETAGRRAIQLAEEAGPITPQMAAQAFQQGARTAFVPASRAAGQAGQEYGQMLGRGVDTLARGGEALIRGAEGAFKLGSRAAGAGGRGLERAGQALSQTGRGLARLEPQAYAQTAGRALSEDMGINQWRPLSPGPWGPGGIPGSMLGMPVRNRNAGMGYGGGYAPPAAAIRPAMPEGYVPYDLEI